MICFIHVLFDNKKKSVVIHINEHCITLKTDFIIGLP